MGAKKKERAHSPLSASGAERWLNCPASVTLSEKAPEPPTNKWAEEGTLAHEFLEKWLVDIIAGKTHVPTVLMRNQNMFEAVKSAVTTVQASFKDGVSLVVEEKLSLAHIHPEMFGTADIKLLSLFEFLDVWDYKHGKGYAVDVVIRQDGIFKPNPQLMYYMLAAAHKNGYNFSEYRIGVIQPRASHNKGPRRFLNVTRPGLKLFEDELKAGVERVYKKSPKVVVGKWCHWCPAREFNCPKHEAVRVEKYKDDFEDLD